MSHAAGPPPSRFLLVANFLSVYVIWGSTYLGIKFAAHTLGLFPLGAIRFVAAGLALFAMAHFFQSAAWPSVRHWRSAALIGIPLLFISNGTVIWSVSRVSSGVAAVIVSMVPLAVVLLEWIRPGGKRPAVGAIVGVWMGIAGMLLLKFPLGAYDARDDLHIDSLTIIALVAACFIWAAASIASRSIPRPESPLMWSGMQMICAGLMHAIAAVVMGQWQVVPWHDFPPKAFWALIYLISFGSIIGFTSYSWLLRVTSTANVSTYAFVNPVVALGLGALLDHERFTAQTLVASLVIIGAVAIITTTGRNGRKAA